MWELDYKESWAQKNWCFWTVVFEKTLESPLDCKEIQPAHPKGDQSRVFIGGTDFEAETPILWPPDMESCLTGKDPDAGKDWGQEEKGTTEDEMVGWHHRHNGHGFGWTPGVGDGQGGLACCSSWGRRVGHDWATELNWLHPLNIKYFWPVSLPPMPIWCSVYHGCLGNEDEMTGHVICIWDWLWAIEPVVLNPLALNLVLELI